MIRLVQRRLIIPRGDTGTFSVPVLSSYNSGDAAVFSIIDPRTHRRVYNQLMYVTDNVLSVKFEHGDTVNLPVGKFLWDIKFYQDPVIEENQVVSGKEVDSYYAAFTMPECEIRQTGDNMLTADDAPGSTLTPQHINAISAALFALNEAVEKTETNVTHYPTIIDGEWNVWDANLGDYTTTGIEATGNGIASIEKTNTVGLVNTYTVNFTDGTTFLYNITNGSGISSITKQSTSGLEDTYVIIYTDGNSTTFTITNGATPNISIGTVQEGPIAAASITGSAANPVLNLTLPNANVPTRVSELENDAGYLTEHQDLSDYVQKTDYATNNEAGVVKVGNGLYAQGGFIHINAAPEQIIKSGTANTAPIVASNQHQSTFYGLAKAAGDTTQSQSSNAVGTYTNEAKVAIQTMLDVPSNADIPTQVSELTNDAGYLTTETDPTVPAWAKAANKPTYTAAEVGAPTVQEMNTAIGTAIGNINSFDIAVVQALPTQDISTHTIYLVPKTGETNDVYDEYVYINNNWEMVGNTQIDLSNYATKDELPDVPVQDVQINGISIVSSGTANIPPADNLNFGTVKVAGEAYGISISGTGFLNLVKATDSQVVYGNNNYRAIVPSIQHASVFYGLAKAAGDSTQSQSSNSVGTYTNDAKAAIQQMLDVPSTDDIPEVPVQDVQVNGTSILDAQGVANVPVASASILGATRYASAAEIKSGNGAARSINPARQDASTFYGLAKAAGADMKDIANATVGTYPDAQKEAIQSMLGISQMLAPTNSNLIASQAYAVGDVFVANGKLYKATAAIAQDAAIIPDTNCVETTMAEAGGKIKDVQVAGTSVVENGTANVPLATRNSIGVINGGNKAYGIEIGTNGNLRGVPIIDSAVASDIKSGVNYYKPIVPHEQHMSTFYGLSKVAGVDLANETVTLGTYPETSKTAIRAMLGATSNNVIAVQDTQPTDPDTKIWLPETPETPVQVPTVAEMNAALSGKVSDVQVNGTSVVTNGVANVPLATASSVGVTRTSTDRGTQIYSQTILGVSAATTANVKDGSNLYRPIVPAHQHESVFYGLATAASDLTQSQSSNAVGNYTDDAKAAIKSMIGVNVDDVQVNETSVVSNGVATIPIATSNNIGLAKYHPDYGINITAAGQTFISGADSAMIKNPTGGYIGYKPIVAGKQHESVFYGLAKASGDTTQSASSNAVGTYTDNAKASIKSMLGIVDGSTGTVSVSGTTPAITAVENTRYVCGEVSTLSFTPPASGISIVRFTSGTTAAVLTLPSTVKFPEWFDATSLEADTIYEICVTDGIYGAVMSWAL